MEDAIEPAESRRYLRRDQPLLIWRQEMDLADGTSTLALAQQTNIEGRRPEEKRSAVAACSCASADAAQRLGRAARMSVST